MVGGRMTVMKKIYLLIILIFFSNYAHSKDYKFLCIPKEISKVYNFKTFKFIDEYFDPYQDDIIITINENKLIDEWGKEFVRFKKSTEKIMIFALRSNPESKQFVFHRYSGRLTLKTEGTRYGTDPWEVQWHRFYNCSKFVKPLL